MNHFKHLILSGLLLLESFSLSGQNRECVVSQMYKTTVYDAKPLSRGRFALAVQDNSIPGALGEYNFSLVILDSLGRFEHQFPIEVGYHNETSIISLKCVLPDDEVIIQYATGNCDAGFHAFEIQKIDSLGNRKWRFGMPHQEIVGKIWVAPDGNLIVNNGKYLSKWSIESGESLWRYLLPFSYPTNFTVVPGTEDLIIADTVGLKYFLHHEDSTGISYILDHSFDFNLDSGFMYLTGYENGYFYVEKVTNRELFRFQVDLNPESVIILPYRPVFISGDYLLMLEGYPQRRIHMYDMAGNYINKYEPLREDGFDLKGMSVLDDGLVVFGGYISGPGGLLVGRQQGWVRYFPEFNFTEEPQIFSASLTNIIEEVKIDIDSFYSPGPDYDGYLYNLEGGKFKMEITNTGSETIESFSVNIGFQEITNYWFCPPYSASFKFFENQNIEPGTSTWVEFDSIEAYRQKSVPAQLCFWTSGINYRPDDIPEDDRYCFDRIVSTKQETQGSFLIYPNPAGDVLYISNHTFASSVEWGLRDIYGRIAKKGLYDDDQETLSIVTSDLPSGIYYFETNGVSTLVVIQH